MPKKPQSFHPLMRSLPAALGARMTALGHSQIEVSAATGVPQPQISRALRGARKRLTPDMEKLCRYALLGVDAPADVSDTALEVTLLMRQLIGDSTQAAAHMKAVLRSLAPLIADYRQRTSP